MRINGDITIAPYGVKIEFTIDVQNLDRLSFPSAKPASEKPQPQTTKQPQNPPPAAPTPALPTEAAPPAAVDPLAAAKNRDEIRRIALAYGRTDPAKMQELRELMARFRLPDGRPIQTSTEIPDQMTAAVLAAIRSHIDAAVSA